ncbi:MAG TPA: DNA-formamidopyrimidine glycosylase family protein [Terriglobia bacterium]|nr:DNA-formamidopyrimidine glycosylase family protein [Terriglobia bacterium]
MPELPDIVIYIEALERRILGEKLQRVRLASPFLLRSVTPPIQNLEGTVVQSLERIGKRIAIGFENENWLVLHLMIAGRLHWREPGSRLAPRRALAALDFAHGSLVLTEAGSKKRASLHVVHGAEGLKSLDPGGLEVLNVDLPAFLERLRSENHTLKRALTDPRLFSGIGNAYSDEILHAAGLSPASLTARLSDDEIGRLYEAARQTLREWTDRLRRDNRDRFPEKVTAFREGMAVHGRYDKPCPRCGAKVQRIRYAENETNYCPRCQTQGKLLADRSLSRLLKQDWPRTVEALEELTKKGHAGSTVLDKGAGM